jgi:hypothetical protein
VPADGAERPTAEQRQLSRRAGLDHELRAAEHGTGQNAQKKGFLVTMFGEKGVEEMRQVKRAFDPEGILSPGNMFDLSVQTN